MFRQQQGIPPVLSREEFVHPAGLLRPPQRLAAVGVGRLDPGEDGAPRAAQRTRPETRGPRQPGGGAPEADHTQTLQLNPSESNATTRESLKGAVGSKRTLGHTGADAVF